MIRTIPVPTSVSRLGCTPGGNCCDECRTGPPIGPAATHVHSLGDVSCDDTGTCTATASASTLAYVAGGLGLVLLIELFNRRRR